MADSQLIDQISIRQRRRLYFWRAEQLPIPRREIVRIGGYPVDVDRDNGWRWRTSMTREDTGAGACEIILVTKVSRR